MTKLFLLPLLLIASSITSVIAQSDDRPNIVVVMTDDESAFERSLYGWSDLPTPSLDRLAKSGVVFENGFSSAPSCAPARAAFLTGRNFWELEQGAFIQAYLPNKYPLLPAHLETHGYAIGRIGKGWGPGVYPTDAHGHDSAGPETPVVKLESPEERMSNRDYAASFAAFLESKEQSKPFFYWAGIYEPHRAFPKDAHIKLEQKYGISVDEIQMPPFIEDTPKSRIDRAQYLYELLYADEQLGRLLDVLESSGLSENTIFVYTADNGSPFKNAKSSSSLRGVHVPLVISWPAKSEGGRSVTDFVGFPDMAPTFLEAAQVEPMPGISGHSFLKTLTAKESGRINSNRDYYVNGLEWHGEFDPKSLSYRAISTETHTLAFEYNAPDGSAETDTNPARIKLFDRINDPWEQNDLSKSEEHQELITELTAKMNNYGVATDDPRFTGDMELFNQTRAYVQKRKRLGYTKTYDLPFTD